MKKKLFSIVLLLLFWTAPVFAQSDYVDGWLGDWDVEMKDGSEVTWSIDKTWRSASGMSHLAYGIKDPGNVEFMIYFSTMVNGHMYIEMEHTQDIYDLPQDLTQYTELVPRPSPPAEFTSFTAEDGPYPIQSGVREGHDPGPDPDPDPDPEPCAATYLLGADDPRLDILRQFRDQKMSASQTGNDMISMYYEKSEDIIATCEVNPFAKWSYRTMLEAIIPVIQIML